MLVKDNKFIRLYKGDWKLSLLSYGDLETLNLTFSYSIYNPGGPEMISLMSKGEASLK